MAASVGVCDVIACVLQMAIPRRLASRTAFNS
jgi:hypothetical protein